MDSVLMMRDCAWTVDFDNQILKGLNCIYILVSFRDLLFIKSWVGVFFIWNIFFLTPQRHQTIFNDPQVWLPPVNKVFEPNSVIPSYNNAWYSNSKIRASIFHYSEQQWKTNSIISNSKLWDLLTLQTLISVQHKIPCKRKRIALIDLLLF